MPGLTIGDSIPNLEVETTHGVIKLHEYIDTWTILFSHPGDFTPVCTTELGKMAAHAPEFAKRGVKLLGLSCDDVSSHVEWVKDIEAYAGTHKILNMVDPDEKDSSGHNVPSRALHIVGADKMIKLSFLYPASTGRNMDEVVRALDSLERASRNKIATPANWKPGEDVVISPSVSDEEAKTLFPQGFKTVGLPSNKGYLRFTNVDR
ncbi:Peroxiredoxin family protein [Salix suchowensis]|nr:Peroxiredoxin family protein [Salix suchowensis]